MISKRFVRRFYPSLDQDGTVVFYRWVRAYTNASTQLLNLGAGPPTRAPLRIFKGEVARVVGADIDPVVLGNPELDEAVVIVDGRLPLPDASFDVIVSDYVFEHVRHPPAFLAEASRVLKPGGHLFFRTPNRFHYVAVIAALTPHWFHELVANRVRGLDADAHEPWPTVYALNTRRAIEHHAVTAGFTDVELRMFESEPAYLKFGVMPYLAGVAYERTVNLFDRLSSLRANIFGRLGRD